MPGEAPRDQAPAGDSPAPPPAEDRAFHWQDGDRLILFGRGRLAGAADVLGSGYTLLSTPRAASAAPPGLIEAAAAVHEVGPGRVDELAAGLRPRIDGELLVAFGGGRVIDVAKALAAADPPRRVAAIPTTLSGAEMTAIHRHAEGVALQTERVRPSIIINDPQLSASQPLPELAASAANALAHAAEGPLTPLCNPVAVLSAIESARLIAGALAISLHPRHAEPGPSERDALALGALLAGYVISSTGYGLHHVLAQALVRFAGVSHGAANAIMLPHSLVALRRRAPASIGRLTPALSDEPEVFAARLCALTGTTRLRDAGASEADLDRCADEAAGRPELQLTPPPADRDELRECYQAAY